MTNVKLHSQKKHVKVLFEEIKMELKSVYKREKNLKKISINFNFITNVPPNPLVLFKTFETLRF